MFSVYVGQWVCFNWYIGCSVISRKHCVYHQIIWKDLFYWLQQLWTFNRLHIFWGAPSLPLSGIKTTYPEEWKHYVTKGIQQTIYKQPECFGDFKKKKKTGAFWSSCKNIWNMYLLYLHHAFFFQKKKHY